MAPEAKRVIKRILSIIPAVAVHVLWYVLLFKWLSPWATAIEFIVKFLAVIYILYIITNTEESMYKILWILVILGLPLLGVILYLMYGNKRSVYLLKRRLENHKLDYDKSMEESVSSEIADPRMQSTIKYMENITGHPLRWNEKSTYFPLGDDMYPVMLEKLKEAKKFIFIEYFILEPGVFWNSIVDILEEKVKEGVEVKVLYDDLGSVGTYSRKEAKKLREKGIECHAFNPAIMLVGTLNSRDHRKMMIIDGKVAFTGGINLSDEYINRIQKYGHWKDIGFCTEGEAVKNYTAMFIEFWNAFTLNSEIKREELEKLIEMSSSSTTTNDGYILSYMDSPIKVENASNEFYIEMLSMAENYAYFFTPYLMLGEHLLAAFVRAAKRGVDVRIIMPGIPDKKVIYRMSRSFYPPLLQAGVKIYEYVPGFVHAKGAVFDGKVATVGTVNLDYRSLFLHFENNAIFYESSMVREVEKDFLDTLEQCEDVSCKKKLRFSMLRWFVNGVLRTISPLC